MVRRLAAAAARYHSHAHPDLMLRHRSHAMPNRDSFQRMRRRLCVLVLDTIPPLRAPRRAASAAVAAVSAAFSSEIPGILETPLFFFERGSI